MENPLHLKFNQSLIKNKTVHELIGLAGGIIADGVVTQSEAEFLKKWIIANGAGSFNNPFIMPLYEKLEVMLEDGVLDDKESADLLKTLTDISGGDFELGELKKSTAAVFDKNAFIDFLGREFCITGAFNYGERRQVEKVILDLGGEICQKYPKATTDFVVVGTYASAAWKHGNYGKKIEKAMEWRKKGYGIQIISEAQFLIAKEESDPPGELYGKMFVLTGTLSVPREQIKREIERLGGKVVNSVSGRTDFLVAGDVGESSLKQKKARELREEGYKIQIIDESELEKKLKGSYRSLGDG